VSATFGVPGLMSVPSDGAAHSVPIALLELEADMSWVCVPKRDCRVHLRAGPLHPNNLPYYPCTKKVPQSGLHSQSSNYTSSQRMTVHSSQSSSSSSGVKVKIIDQVLSQRTLPSPRTVQLVQLALVLPAADVSTTSTSKDKGGGST
jgi:hypothetical protein